MFAFCVIRDSDPGLNKGKAKALYSLLVSYSDVTTRNTDQGYPYRSALADALDCTKDTVDNATKYLEREIGLIRVVRRKVDGKPDENDANAYQVYDQWLIQGCEPTPDTPPQLVARYGPTIPGFDVDAWISVHAPSFDLAAWRSSYEDTVGEQEAKRAAQRQKEAKRRKAGRVGGSGTDSATGGGTGSATGGGMYAALSRTGSPEPSSPDDAAPSGGVAPGEARRASTGSRGSSSSGSAASGKKQPSSLTRDQRQQVQAVRALLPGLLNQAIGTKTPSVVSQAVLEALAVGEPHERTAEQLVRFRVERRWDGYWASKFSAGELVDGNGRPRVVGPLLAMLKAQPECGSARCDDRVDVDSGEACRACEMRKLDRRAERAATVPEQPAPIDRVEQVQAKPAVVEPVLPAARTRADSPDDISVPVEEVVDASLARAAAREAVLNRPYARR
ncbi:hypothetical protein [Streptomyces zhihengii]